MKSNFKNTQLNFDAERISSYDEQEIGKIDDTEEGVPEFYLAINDNCYLYHNEDERDYDYCLAIQFFGNSVVEMD